MRIGIICFPGPGGSGVVATDLGRQLARRGHEIHFISYERPFRLPEAAREEEAITFHQVKAPSYPLFPEPLYFIALVNTLARLAGQLDVIHVHYAVPHAASAALARQMLEEEAPALVTTIHGSDVTLVGADPSLARVTAFSLNDSDAVTAVSSFLRDEAQRRLDLRTAIHVISNFIDAGVFQRRFDPSLRAGFAAPEERLMVHISNFRPVKRVPAAVDIFARLAGRVPARLLLVGEGPDLEAARAVAAALGVAERVHFVGRQPDVTPYLSIADVFLFPSRNESFGVAAAEAMACGVPVVASRVGGIPELVEDGLTGYLVSPEDLEGMAEKATRLLLDPALGRRLGEAGARRVREHFTPEGIVPLYEDVYARALERHQARRRGAGRGGPRLLRAAPCRRRS